jgi:site-specific DNA recombinase
MRAAVYARISLDKSGEGAGVERQRDDCARLIEQRGWTLATTHEDNSISAADTRKRRPGFEALLTDVAAGKLDMIVAWAWDRLSRNRRDEVRLIEACKTHGVSVALVRGAGDLDMSSAVGRAVAEILATVGRMEIEQKGERQRAAFAQRAQKGLPWGPIPAFGYADDRVTVLEHEAELIRAAYAAALSGTPCLRIADEWNDAGVRTRTGGSWSGSAVRRVLINPRYMGVRGSSVGTGNRRDLVEVAAASWPGIVDEPTWRAAHAVLTDPARTTTTNRRRVHLLPGIALCGLCGAPMRSYTHGRGWPAYSCSKSRHVVRKAAPVDAFVSEYVVRWFGRPDALRLVSDARPDGELLHEKAEALRGRLDVLAEQFADGVLTPSQLRAATERIRASLAEVQGRMVDAVRAPALAGMATAADVRAHWGGLALEQRRAVIAAAVDVTILPATRRGPGFDPKSVKVAPKSVSRP